MKPLLIALQLLLLRQTGVATDAQLLVFDSQRRNNMFHTHAKFQVCSLLASSSINSAQPRH